MRIYEDSGMIIFANDAGTTILHSVPKGSVSINIVQQKFQFYSKVWEKFLTNPLAYTEVLDSSGVAYAANFADTLTALDAFLNTFFFDGLVWQVAQATSTDNNYVAVVSLDDSNYPEGTIINIWGKFFAKKDSEDQYYTGTFTAAVFRTASGFQVSTPTIAQITFENFAINPQMRQQVTGNLYKIEVRSGPAAITSEVNWELKYLFDAKTLG